MRMWPGLLLVVSAATGLLLAGGAARAESNLVAHFYAAETAGVAVDRLSMREHHLSSDARDRLRNHGALSWAVLSGLQQRALLWDAGLVLTSPTSGPAQILTACSLSMSDIMLDAQVVRQLVATAANSSAGGAVCELSRCGGNAAFLERCATDAIAFATRCVVDTATLGDLGPTPGAFWAEDGGSDALPSPILREHSSAGASGRLFAIHVTDAAFVGERSCETSGRIIIPCRAKTAGDVGLCTPAKGGTLDAWLRLVSAPAPSAFSSTSAVLLILALVLCALQAGALYYLVKYRLRGKSADDSDAESQTSDLLSREQLHGSSPMEMFEHAGGGRGGRGADAGVSNDALCAKSSILRRFVADPQVVTKRISANQLTFLRVLSKGGNGEVWLGQYESRYDRAKNKMKSMQIVHLVSEGKLLPTFRDDCPPLIVELARECLELDPAKRPTAMEVIFRLRSTIFPLLNPAESSGDGNGDGFGSSSSSA
ncbi:hypothetical protein PybrP1_008361 [[Pythium] brassicae (nom. inval.)]|nr:hypothetical protein PybrP1_008361 [[Pythium] brassicae (nom. inval.)]